MSPSTPNADHELIGYLLNALEPPEQKAVEEHLRQSVDARKRLALVRRAIQPLDYDCEDPVPPTTLVTDTLKKVAAFKCRPLGPMPASSERGFRRPLWRRPDVLVAASIVFVLLSLIPPSLLYLRNLGHWKACANNLRLFHESLVKYAEDDRHRGRLPAPSARGPLAFAGSFAPQLRDAGYWHSDLSVTCPAAEPFDCPPVMPTCSELQHGMASVRPYRIGGHYGYSLGFEPEAGGYRGLQLGDSDHLGVMADQPPRPGQPFRNSPNHGGKGQNVLYLGGHVRRECRREVDGDDLFANRWGQMLAGKGAHDTVIGYSEAEPFPGAWCEKDCLPPPIPPPRPIPPPALPPR